MDKQFGRIRHGADGRKSQWSHGRARQLDPLILTSLFRAMGVA